MSFCSNCGKEIENNAKFCTGCGKFNDKISIRSQEQRNIIFDGEIHKCPHCGEVLASFVIICPACGYEVRGSSTTNALKEFTNKLDNATTEYQKSNVIRSFPIPNTKEDIFEFMIMASSNIDEHPNKQVFDAWIAKFEQCYEKAKLSFQQDSDFLKIQSIHDRTIKEIRRIKLKGPLKKFLMVAIPVIGFIAINIVFWTWVLSPDPKAEAAEVARLEAIVNEVESALGNEEYDLAMLHAKSIDYSAYKSNNELERQWDIKRDYLIKKIIDVAAEDGIVMEYPTNTADEKDKQNVNNYSNSTSKGYQQNIEEFNNRLENTEEQLKSIGNDSNNQADTSKEELIGFEDGTYKTTNVKNFTFEIPNYWQEEGSKNEYLQYYAEKGDKCVMLSIAYPKEPDDKYDVSFDGLYADNENMIQAVGAMFTDGDVIDYEIFESNYGVKGILYRFTYNQKIDWFTKTDGSGYCFCFPSEDERRWFYVVLLHTNNISSDRYTNDYMTLISSIKEKS